MAYKVLLETTAVLDLRGIFAYIKDVLKQPETAKRILVSIEAQIMTLDQMPARHSIVRDEPYATLGVRILPVENYTAFYVIDESTEEHIFLPQAKKCVPSLHSVPFGEVRVLRILYNRRDWQRLL